MKKFQIKVKSSRNIIIEIILSRGVYKENLIKLIIEMKSYFYH